MTMDTELPGMGGLAAIEEVMSGRPLPILVIAVDASQESKKAAALAAGALDAIPKQDIDLGEPEGAAAAALRHRVKVVGHARVLRHPRARLRGGPAEQRPGRRASVIGICGSTGGPYLLASLLNDLPADYALPILAVQHISAGFTEGLARLLDQSVRLPGGIARDRAAPGPRAWVSPDGAHPKLAPTGRLRLDS